MNWLDRKIENGVRSKLLSGSMIIRRNNKDAGQLKQEIRKKTININIITLILTALAILFFLALYPSLPAILFVDGVMVVYVFTFRYTGISHRMKLKILLEGKK